MDWARDGATWPLAEYSTFIDCPPHRWHVQRLGAGPTAVLLHGAGGATQSFRHLAPLLARDFEVLMMDYPGQGFTRMGTRQRCGLMPLAQDIRSLLAHLGLAPDIIVGHSAGAAVGLAMSRELGNVPVVGINPALGHFEGAAGWLFPMLAKVLALTPFVPQLFALAARSKGRVEGLLASTGSRLGPAGTALYRRLVEDPAHVEATLLMMAQWSLDPLLERLGEIEAPVLFCVGERDGAVPPRVASEAAERLPNATVATYSGAGHLLHETHPEDIAGAVLEAYAKRDLSQPSSA